MKNILYALLACIILVSCSVSPEKKAQKLIEKQLQESLHDWKSYESVKFGTLDSVYTDTLDDSVYLHALARFEAYKDIRDKKADEYFITHSELLQKQVLELADSVEKYSLIKDSIEKVFEPQFNGWSMNHTFRANNANGNKVIGHHLYTFDKKLIRILDSEDIGENN